MKKTTKRNLMIGGAVLLLWYLNQRKANTNTGYVPPAPVKPQANQPINSGAPAVSGVWEINCYHQVI